MKKVIFPLILFLALSGAFATAFEFEGAINDNSGHISSEKDAYTVLTLDNTDTELQNIGFTLKSDIPSDFSLESVVTTKDSYELSVDRENGNAKSKEDDIHVFYQIKSGEDLVISLYGSDVLKGDNHQESISWHVKCNDKTLDVLDGSGNSRIEVYKHNPTEKTYGAFGSFAIDIYTGDLWNKPADVYRASICLDIRLANNE